MQRRLRWGILGVAKIAVNKVIPAMRLCQWCEPVAIASRDARKAQQAAAALGLPRAFGSYEELLADPEIDVIYNPLPNHLHVPWSIRALEAGKHVLCEKPLGLSTSEVRALIDARNRAGQCAGEAFMVRTHPQWLRVKELADSGAIGPLRQVQAWFSYFNRDPANVRNVPEYGGGGLLDIGCYPVFLSRFLFGEEPVRAACRMDIDPQFGVDRSCAALLEFPSGTCVFTCATQLAPAQRVIVFGEKARIEVEIPFNAPNDRPCRLLLDDGSDLAGGSRRVEEVPVCDQYAIQADEFSLAAMGRRSVPVPLEDSLRTMAVIEALQASARSGRMEPVASF
ncbi:MAG: Gfo/Idh/MocA family oxidoreductase [Bryobacteraceae bacterium]|nr:Gfo/Idh/MocA family oxidoreductase [Bryobacteraceae bacterium]